VAGQSRENEGKMQSTTIHLNLPQVNKLIFSSFSLMALIAINLKRSYLLEILDGFGQVVKI
jgi:hypothetical protein